MDSILPGIKKNIVQSNAYNSLYAYIQNAKPNISFVYLAKFSDIKNNLYSAAVSTQEVFSIVYKGFLLYYCCEQEFGILPSHKTGGSELWLCYSKFHKFSINI